VWEETNLDSLANDRNLRGVNASVFAKNEVSEKNFFVRD